jgi:hypothetical protein
MKVRCGEKSHGQVKLLGASPTDFSKRQRVFKLSLELLHVGPDRRRDRQGNKKSLFSR